MDPKRVSQYDTASLLAMMNMLKINLLGTPEIYRTLLAVLVDFDPAENGNRDRTTRYIKLLVTDKVLANCLVLSLPSVLLEVKPVCTPKPLLPKLSRMLKNRKVNRRYSITTKRLTKFHPELVRTYGQHGNNQTIELIVKGKSSSTGKVNSSRVTTDHVNEGALTTVVQHIASVGDDCNEQHPTLNDMPTLANKTEQTSTTDLSKHAGKANGSQCNNAITTNANKISNSNSVEKTEVPVTMVTTKPHLYKPQAIYTHWPTQTPIYPVPVITGQGHIPLSSPVTPACIALPRGQGHIQTHLHMNSVTSTITRPGVSGPMPLQYCNTGFNPMYYPGVADYQSNYAFSNMVPWHQQPYYHSNGSLFSPMTSGQYLNRNRSASENDISIDLSVASRSAEHTRQLQDQQQGISSADRDHSVLLKRSVSDYAQVSTDFQPQPKMLRLNVGPINTQQNSCETLRHVNRGSNNMPKQVLIGTADGNEPLETQNILKPYKGNKSTSDSLQALNDLTKSIGAHVSNHKVVKKSASTSSLCGTDKSQFEGQLTSSQNKIARKSNDESSIKAQKLVLSNRSDIKPGTNTNAAAYISRTFNVSNNIGINSTCVKGFPYTQQLQLLDVNYSVVKCEDGSVGNANQLQTNVQLQREGHAISNINTSVVGQATPQIQQRQPKTVYGSSSNNDGKESVQTDQIKNLETLYKTDKKPTIANLQNTQGTIAYSNNSNVHLETTNGQKSTQVKIKLDKHGQLLGELLKLKTSSPLIPSAQRTESSIESKISQCVVPATRSRSESSISATKDESVLQQILARKVAVPSRIQMQATSANNNLPQGKTIPYKQGIITVQGQSIIGQAFPIQAKTDKSTNRISISDQALLQTIKDRLNTNSQKQRAYSDSALVNNVAPQPNLPQLIKTQTQLLYRPSVSSVSSMEGNENSPTNVNQAINQTIPNSKVSHDGQDNAVISTSIPDECRSSEVLVATPLQLSPASGSIHTGLSPYLLGMLPGPDNIMWDTDDDVFLEEYITPNVVKFRPKLVGAVAPNSCSVENNLSVTTNESRQ